ncbi:MAG: arginine deiminase family protein, partial [Bacillota bacterium]
DYLLELPDRETVSQLMAGLSKETVAPLKKHRHFSDLTTRSYPFFLDPMPSMYFTRDHGAMIRDRLLVSEMFNFARRRETLFIRYLQRYHPLFVETPLWIDGEIPTGIEGGDMLIINPQTLLIGFSERTTEQAIEYVAHKLLIEHQELEQIIVVQIPAKRAYMHLDTVFTMVDYDKFVLYPGVEESLEVYALTRGLGDMVEARREDDLAQTLGRALRVRKVEIIHSGGNNPITAAREQWSDSSNTLTVAPGKVICYNRNQVTNRVLREHGIEVIEIEGSELVRGRGGPRCMSMPLARAAVQS